MKLKITAIAIVLNDENYIKEYLKKLSFVDQIIIIDCKSNDKTKLIALENCVEVFDADFQNYANQINLALTKSKNDWIVQFEINDVITDEIISEISKIDLKTNKNIAFSIKRNFLFLIKKINFGGFQTKNKIILFNKNFVKFQDIKKIKEIKTFGNIEKIKNLKLNHEIKNFDYYNNKLSFYADLQSESMYFNNIKTYKYQLFFRPTYRFFWQYFFRLGFLDGKEGFILANIHAFAVFKRYLLLWMKYRKIEK